MSRRAFFILSIVSLGLFLSLIIFLLNNPEKNRAQIQIADQEWTVLLSDTPRRRYAGLSGLLPEDLGGAAGMLFVYPSAQERTFVMRGMLFPLDFVWLAGDRVVKVDLNIPPPSAGEVPLEITSAPFVVDKVLEFPAGFVTKWGIGPGSSIIYKK